MRNRRVIVDIVYIRSRHMGELEMFRVALYEVHTVSNVGSPPLYFDRWQHRDTILEDVAASSVQPPCGLSVRSIGNRTAHYIHPLCGSLGMKGFLPWEFCMTWLVSALGGSRMALCEWISTCGGA